MHRQRDPRSAKEYRQIRPLRRALLNDDRGAFRLAKRRHQRNTGYVRKRTLEFDTLTAEAERATALRLERRSALISAAVTG